MKDIKAVFDIGNDVIKGIVFANDNGRDVILVKQMEPSRGIRKGKILDSEAFTRTINKITENFIKKLGGDFIDEVFVGISHPDMLIERISEQKRIMKPSIEQDDVNHLSRIVGDISIKDNYETIKIIPVHRVIDGEKKEKDPIGLQGKKLELVADIFMLPKNFYNNIIDTFDRVGLTIIDVVPNIIAASEIALDYDHKDLGCILMDIGKNHTSYVVYEDGYPLTYGTLPIGGEDVTKDISIGMQIDIKEADTIKKTHGSAVMNPNKSNDTELDIHFLTDIINARYEEIFNKVNNHLIDIEKDGKLPGGIILLGGGAKMNNIDILCKDIFKLATFFAKDRQLNLGDISNNIQFVNTLGVYVRSNKYTDGRKGNFKLDLNIIDGVKSLFKSISEFF